MIELYAPRMLELVSLPSSAQAARLGLQWYFATLALLDLEAIDLPACVLATPTAAF
jgi:hypothetical protein